MVLDAVGHLSSSVNAVLHRLSTQDENMELFRNTLEQHSGDHLLLKEDVHKDIAHLLEIVKKIAEGVDKSKTRPNMQVCFVF